jgi:hypothetical protein
MTVNTATTYPISRWIYGINVAEKGGNPAGAFPWYGAQLPSGVTMNRYGGNRMSAWNWETGASNVGADGNYANDNFLVNNGAWYNYSGGAGSSATGRVTDSFSRNQGILLTIPMLGYVAGDKQGVALTTTDVDRTARLAAHFKVSKPTKGTAFTLTPDSTDGFVYQDEFANLLNTTFPGAATSTTKPIFLSLDNEPDIWNATHKEVMSDSSDNPLRPRIFTYTAFTDMSAQYAAAVKAAMPGVQVFGPAVATYAGLVSGGRYVNNNWASDPVYGQQNFTSVYLARMKAAETTYGKRLLDVLDIHYYSAAGIGGFDIQNDFATQNDTMVGARLQSTRSLWDTTYNEGSWVNGVTGGPIGLIPRLKAQIAANYPGTKIAITEYFWGRSGDISGGIAQADALGIFGREGVFAAMMWPNVNVYATPYGGDGVKAYAYALSAFSLFVNFDGAGARFGDTGVSASTSDNTASSIYASLDATQRVVIIAINKNKTSSSTATINVSDSRALKTVAYAARMTSTAAGPTSFPTKEVFRNGSNKFTYVMPALSASVIVLTP